MRILLVTQYFPPEIGAPQARLSELAQFWAEDGEDVVVLTGMPNHPTGLIPDRYRRKVRCEERAEGYRIVRTWLYATPNEGVLKKTLSHLSFMVSSVLLGGAKVGRPDVVVVSSPTFFSMFSAWALARWKHARLVVEVRDLWPAIFVELGVLKNRSIIRILEWLELAMYRAADHVVVVSEGFKDNLVSRGVPAAKVTTIRNGVDVERFTPAEPDPSARQDLGATDRETLVLYIGAHGVSHGLLAVADAAAKASGHDIHVTFVGEGADKPRLAAHIRDRGITNVTMRPGVERSEVPRILAAADVCLVPLRDVPLFSTFIPSKIFEYLAAGKAIVGSVRGEPAEILREAGAVVVEPEDVDAIAAALVALSDDKPRRAAMGLSGRAYVVAHFDRRTLATRYLDEVLRPVVAVAS